MMMITTPVEGVSLDLCCLPCVADVLRFNFLGGVIELSDVLTDVGACSSLVRA